MASDCGSNDEERPDVWTWLQMWYVAQCDDEWEHAYGIKIETLDNAPVDPASRERQYAPVTTTVPRS